MNLRHLPWVLLAMPLWVPCAQGVVLFFDTGDIPSGVLGGPLDNSNPVVVLPPGGQVALHLWAIPDTDDEKVVASLGHDVLITGTAAGDVASTAYTLDNPLIGANARWTTTGLIGGLNAPGKLVDDQRAFFIPSAAPFVGGVGSANLSIDPGYDAGSGAVYLGQLDLQIAFDATPGTSAELRLAVGQSLIAGVTTASPADEVVYFGYDPGGPELASGSGAVPGATTTIADAVIVVTIPGDLDGDMIVDSNDYDIFTTCFTGANNGPVGPGCAAADFDGDDDIDCDDWTDFKSYWTGPPAIPPRFFRCDVPQSTTPPGVVDPAGPLPTRGTQPIPEPQPVLCPGDLNDDGNTDTSDLAQLLAHYGITSGADYADGDLDYDEDVDISDLGELLAHYGEVCQ